MITSPQGRPNGRRPDLLAEVGRVARQLQSSDLAPGPLVDGLFRRLVAAAGALSDGAPLTEDGAAMAALHRLCARGETLLERHWAREVLADPRRVEAFPYQDNYRLLARGEYGAVRRALGHRPRSVVIAGSGPLPLTAVELHRVDPDLRITCLDVDAEAAVQGARVAPALCRDAGRLQFRHADAAAFDYSDADVVLVGALVGLDPREKVAVLRACARGMRRGALLAARSVPTDGRRLLYPRIDPESLPAELEVLDEWQPPEGVVNSLLLLRHRRRRHGLH